MSTKDRFLRPDKNLLDICDYNSDTQFINFHLNQKFQKSSYIPSESTKNISFKKRKPLDYDFSNHGTKKDFHSWKNLTKKDIYLVNYKNVEDEWKKDSNTKSSPLSFHIKVYEKDSSNLNDGTKDEGLKRIKKEIFAVSKSVFQNPFEFSRHQENDHTDVPEIAQYKASQQLYNPNQMDQWALNELPHYSDALYIIFLVFGIVFSIIGICGTIYSIKRTRSIGPKLEEQFKIVHDDQLNYPRCAVAAAEQNISVATPWKHYFTRDEQPFIKETPLP